jgi:lysophospholipase L1-like esterase
LLVVAACAAVGCSGGDDVAESSDPSSSSSRTTLACTADTTTGCYRGNPAGPRVAIVGDSIMWLTDAISGRLDPALADAYAFNVAATPAKRIDEMQPELDRLLAAGPDSVVIDLGTNDMGQSWPSWEQSFDAMWAAVADESCVVYVTIRTQAGQPIGAQINAKIAATAAANPNVRIYDWETDINTALAASQADPSLPPPLSDPVHPTSDGSDILAAGVRRALDTCPRRPN